MNIQKPPTIAEMIDRGQAAFCGIGRTQAQNVLPYDWWNQEIRYWYSEIANEVDKIVQDYEDSFRAAQDKPSWYREKQRQLWKMRKEFEPLRQEYPCVKESDLKKNDMLTERQ